MSEFEVTYLTPDGKARIERKATLHDACRFAVAIPARFRVSIEEIEVYDPAIFGPELEQMLELWTDVHIQVTPEVTA